MANLVENMVVISSEDTPSLVVAFTILNGLTLDQGRITDDSEMILAVRSGTNPVQPHVISSPTQRAPNVLLEELITYPCIPSTLGDFQLPKYASESFYFDLKLPDSLARGHDSARYAVNSVLAAKLGVAESLEKDEITYVCMSGGLVKGYITHEAGDLRPGRNPQEEDGSNKEWHDMANILVVVQDGFDLFPKQTAAYDLIFKQNVADFERRMRGEESVQVPDTSPFSDYSVGGLCVLSSYVALQNCRDQKFVLSPRS